MEGKSTMSTRQQFNTLVTVIELYNLYSESQTPENTPQQDVQTNLPQIIQPAKIPDTKMHTKATKYQENTSEQTGSNIGITVLRINTQESQTTILL